MNMPICDYNFALKKLKSTALTKLTVNAIGRVFFSLNDIDKKTFATKLKSRAFAALRRNVRRFFEKDFFFFKSSFHAQKHEHYAAL